MRSTALYRVVTIGLAAVAFYVTSDVLAQEFSLTSNESFDINAVYWVSNCKSLLNGTMSVEILEGPPGVALTIRQADVLPRKQNCPNMVPGGIVVASVKDVPEKVSGTLRYRVQYNTVDGLRQSSHAAQISLYP